MQVNYCDLCGTPMKENDYFMLYVSEPKVKSFNDMEDYADYLKKVERGVKEICPSCKNIFDKMFELKLQRLSELTEELNYTYNLQSKPNLRDRKNGKEKK